MYHQYRNRYFNRVNHNNNNIGSALVLNSIQHHNNDITGHTNYTPTTNPILLYNNSNNNNSGNNNNNNNNNSVNHTPITSSVGNRYLTESRNMLRFPRTLKNSNRYYIPPQATANTTITSKTSTPVRKSIEKNHPSVRYKQEENTHTYKDQEYVNTQYQCVTPVVDNVAVDSVNVDNRCGDIPKYYQHETQESQRMGYNTFNQPIQQPSSSVQPRRYTRIKAKNDRGSKKVFKRYPGEFLNTQQQRPTLSQHIEAQQPQQSGYPFHNHNNPDLDETSNVTSITLQQQQPTQTYSTLLQYDIDSPQYSEHCLMSLDDDDDDDDGGDGDDREPNVRDVSIHMVESIPLKEQQQQKKKRYWTRQQQQNIAKIQNQQHDTVWSESMCVDHESFAEQQQPQSQPRMQRSDHLYPPSLRNEPRYTLLEQSKRNQRFFQSLENSNNNMHLTHKDIINDEDDNEDDDEDDSHITRKSVEKGPMKKKERIEIGTALQEINRLEYSLKRLEQASEESEDVDDINRSHSKNKGIYDSADTIFDRIIEDQFQHYDREVIESITNHGTNSTLIFRLLKNNLLGEGGYGQCFLVQHDDYEGECVLKIIESKKKGAITTANGKKNTNRNKKRANVVEPTPPLTRLQKKNQEQDKGDDNITTTIPKRIMQEIEIHRTLDHPNIVKFYHSFGNAEKYYIAMEPCYGKDLRHFQQYYAARKPIQEHIVSYFLSQIVSALQYLKRQNIIHRDIKLNNILFQDQECRVVKLCDFGLSHKITTLTSVPILEFKRQLDRSGRNFKPNTPLLSQHQYTVDEKRMIRGAKKAASVRELKHWCGTRRYSAPEVLFFSRHLLSSEQKKFPNADHYKRYGYGYEVDVWSLGIVAFTLLTGRQPFSVDEKKIIDQLEREYESDFEKLEHQERKSLIEEHTVSILFEKIIQSLSNQQQDDNIVHLLPRNCPPLSSEALDLLNVTLQIDPSKRASIETLHQHPFITRYQMMFRNVS